MSHAKAGRPLKLRHASLDDAPEICGIHRSYVDRWYRKLDNEQYEVPYSSLSLSVSTPSPSFSGETGFSSQ